MGRQGMYFRRFGHLSFIGIGGGRINAEKAGGLPVANRAHVWSVPISF